MAYVGNKPSELAIQLDDATVTTAKLANDAVTAAKIVDGTIVADDLNAGIITNAKVNASAAIAASKIAISGGANITLQSDGTFDLDNTINLTGGLQIGGTGIIDSSRNISNINNADIDGTLNVQGETTLQTHLNMGDNDKIKLGASADLLIYHDASDSYIEENGSGNLILSTNGTHIQLQASNGEPMVKGIKDGATELYHNNVKKIETTSSGVTVTGNIANASGDLTLDVAGQINLDADSGNIKFRDGGVDIGLFTNDATNFVIRSEVSNKDLIFRGNDGGSFITALTLDMSGAGAATFNSTIASTGINFTGDSAINNTADTAYNIRSSSGNGQHYFGANRTGFSGGVDIARLGSTGTVFNESGADLDFRVEGNGEAHALFVQGSSDNVGIGINTPSAKLHVDPTANVTTSLGTPMIKIGGSQSWAGNGSLFSIGFGYVNSTSSKSPTEIGMVTTNSAGHTTGSLVFATRSGTGQTDAPAERMRIDSSGRLLLGTTTEGEISGDDLTIATTGDTGMTIRSGTSSNGSILFSDGTSGDDEFRGYVQYLHPSNALRFGTNSVERLRIDSSGNVGIGTTTPSSFGTHTSDLVVGTTSGEHGMTIASGTANSGRIQFADNTSSPFRGAIEYAHGSSDALLFYTAGSQRLKIDSSGNVLAISGTIGGLGSYNNTTGSSANVHILSSGVLVRSTSSLRYKNTINDATHGLTELLTLRPVTYKGNNDGNTVFGGLIAEEVHDAGLTEFVQYNDEDKPDAIAYGNMVSLCIKAIQELKVENTALANRIKALENA